MSEPFSLYESPFDGVFTFKVPLFADQRGGFAKYFSSLSRPHLPQFNVAEIFATTSHKNVIRGMHFQCPPLDQSKFIFVLSGQVLEVVLDLRTDSPSYGQTFSTHLRAADADANNEIATGVFVPSGFAHGYLILSDSATVIYTADFDFDASLDGGIAWNSIDFEWPISNPILSDKDQHLPTLRDFKSPFTK
jgi:dTDP-4-dehydrorhamnose 3,5-epimerase